MDQRNEIIDAIKIIGEKLQRKDIKWLIGGSGSLLVHGLDVMPNDIDLVVDINDYEKAKLILEDIIIGNTIVDGHKLKTHLKIGDVLGDLLAYDIDSSKLVKINFYGVGIFVHQLQVEYDYYMARTDKIEANNRKIRLIKEALN